RIAMHSYRYLEYFFFNDSATTEIYPLSLHDALPISKTKEDVWVLPMGGSGEVKPYPVVHTEASEKAGTLSPDGRWLAYASDASDRYEVYVQSFPGGVGKRQVSTGGGDYPPRRGGGGGGFSYAGGWEAGGASRRRGGGIG